MNWKRIAPALAIAAVFALLVYQLWDDGQRFNWQETYEAESRDPYGTQVMLGLLTSYFPEEPLEVIGQQLSQALPEDKLAGGNYVFVGEGLYLDSIDVQTLLSFVGSGNRAFISSRTIPYDLMSYLYSGACVDSYWDDYYEMYDTSARLDFFQPGLRSDTGFVYQFYFRNEMRPYRWQFIGNEFFCEQPYSFQALGYFGDSLVNFARVPYGEGAFFLHTTPLAFTNFHLLEREHLDYAGRVFSCLQEGPIYWDDYNRVTEGVSRNRNDRYWGGNRSLPSESPLRYVLQQPPLAWAWYLLLVAALLYLVFRARRRQRVIPVKEPNTNTSLEFVSTIGRLYFLQNNHRQLARQQMRLLKGFIRERYQLHTQELDDDFAQRLAAKSEVPRPVIDKILLLDRNIGRSNSLTEHTLIEFHQTIEQFYQTCK